MAIIKDFKRIVNDLKNFLNSVRPNVDTTPGTYTRDVIIDAPASELSSLYVELDRASNAQSPEDVSSLDIEKLGANFSVARKGPTPATGLATFFSFDEPPQAIIIPRGTQLATKASVNNTSRQFVTTQEGVLTSVNFDVTTGRYEIDVPIKATIGGTSSNIGAGSITAIINAITGIAGVYNKNPITNGTDFEPLSIYRSRLRTAITGNNVGTTSGYYQTVTRITEVLDAKVASINTGPVELRRNEPGAVNIYIRGTVSTQAPIESFIVTESTPFTYYLKKQPLDVNALNSITIIGSTSGILIRDTDYTIVKDTGIFGGTIRGSDSFVFNTAVLEEQLSILYSYNSLVESVQAYMDADSRKLLGSDLLINAAFARRINVECTIRILPGFIAQTVINSVALNLDTALNAYQIGEEVQQSDIVAVIANTTGVDDVTVPLDLFIESSDTGNITQDASGNLIIPINSYAVPGDITVNVRV